MTDRATRFALALARDRLTLTAWATKHGVTRQHLDAVLNKNRPSRRLNNEIDRYLTEQPETTP